MLDKELIIQQLLIECDRQNAGVETGKDMLPSSTVREIAKFLAERSIVRGCAE